MTVTVNETSSKDTIYTKLALMLLIDDNLGHTLSGLTQIGNIEGVPKKSRLGQIAK